MKKGYIWVIILPMLLGALIALILTPSAKSNFITKLSYNENLNNVYSEITISDNGNTQHIKQYKTGNKYFAQYYIDDESSIIVNVHPEKILFGNSNIATSTTVKQSKDDNSVFWLDKITVSDIKEDTIRRDKSVNTDTYNAKLKDGTNISVTFHKNILSKIEYSNIKYLPMIIKIPPTQEKKGNITVAISNLSLNAQLNKSFIIPEKSENVKLDTMQDLYSKLINNRMNNEVSEEDYDEYYDDEETSVEDFEEDEEAINNNSSAFNKEVPERFETFEPELLPEIENDKPENLHNIGK